MGGGRDVTAKSCGDSRVQTLRAMPSEASREALTEFAAEVLADVLVDDRDLPLSGDPDPAPGLVADSASHLDADPDVGADRVPGPSERAEQAAGLLGQVVDVFVGARRLSAWALWLQLAAAAQLIARWQSSPPIVDGALPDRLDPAPDSAAGALARRLWRVVDELDIWGPVQTGDLAEEFVAAEISAAAGLSHYGAGNVVDAARTLFMTDRLPRTRQILRAGLLDWTKLRTIVSITQTLDDEVCALVEARVIPDADVTVADPLDTLADPAHPGRDLPKVARLTNPALQAALTEAITAIDAEGAARRAAKARRDRYVAGRPLPDTMGRLDITTGQEQVAAVLAGLDHAVAAAKHAGDTRTADQIRTDHAIHLLTGGAHGLDAYPRGHGGDASPRGHGEAADRPQGRYGRRGLQVRLTMPLGTWLGLADEPAVLDGYGPVPAALARQIAADAARDHPTSTTWRCVVVHDTHRTVLGVGDLVPTPRYEPTGRQKSFVLAADVYCVYPGCRTQAWRCDIDHRRPYDHDNPAAGGPTCTCNLHSLCRRHHRLKTAGLITPHPVQPAARPDRERGAPAAPGDIPGDIPPGSLDWQTWTGRRYPYQPPPATPMPADPEIVAACARNSSEPAQCDAGRETADRTGDQTDGQTDDQTGDRTGDRTGDQTGESDPGAAADEDCGLAHWDRARARLLEREAVRNARRAGRGARTLAAWEDDDPDAAPPF